MASTTEAEQAELEEVNREIARIGEHQNAGRLDTARQAIDRLLEKYDGHPRLLHLRALNLVLEGKRAEGRDLMRKVLEHQPEDVTLIVDLGSVLAQDGELEEALALFQDAVDMAPNFSLARSNLGGALVLLNKVEEAIPHLEKAVELEPGMLDAHTNLAQAYIRQGRFDQAIDVLYKALAIDPRSVLCHLSLAAALFRRERHESSLHHARRALELAPNSGEAYLHIGNALAASGQIDEAAEALMKAASRPPMGVAALGRLIHLRKTRPDSPELKLLERFLERADQLQPEPRATIHFAAGKAFDDMGEYGRAIEHLHKGNAIEKDQHPFDRDSHVQRAERIVEVFSRPFIDRVAAPGPTNIAPIIICGMPRSGTTLMDQMFSRHPKVQAGGELAASIHALRGAPRIREALESAIDPQELTPDDFEQLGERYQAYVLREGLRSEHVSDKMPSNYLYIGILAAALPRARFLIMRRHPMDCLFSNYMQHFGQNQPFTTNFPDLGLVYRTFDRVANHWARILPERVRQVQYESVVADPEGTMREVVEFTGLDWDPVMLDHTSSLTQVHTASVAQVREPIYTRAVARWRRYGPLLKDLAAELREFLTEEELAASGIQ